jgi:hypothetical protein
MNSNYLDCEKTRRASSSTTLLGFSTAPLGEPFKVFLALKMFQDKPKLDTPDFFESFDFFRAGQTNS